MDRAMETDRESGIRPLCLVGSGEHARIVADLVAVLGEHGIEGYWGPTSGAPFRHLGSDQDLRLRFAARWAACGFHLSMVGKPGSSLRRGIIEGLADLPIQWETLVHPKAFVSAGTLLGEGCFVGAGAVVQTGAGLDAHVVVNTGAIVEHDVKVGEGVHLAPGAVVGGGVILGAWSVIGLGARVRDHVSIGAGAVIGMGAVVVRNVPPGAWVAGVPARAMSKEG